MMKNTTLAKRYKTLICKHFTSLGYSPVLKGDSSFYTEVGGIKVRISDHVGFDPSYVWIIVSPFKKDFVVVVKNEINVYPSLKEVKDFISSFVFYQETVRDHESRIYEQYRKVNEELNNANRTIALLTNENKVLETSLDELHKSQIPIMPENMNYTRDNGVIIINTNKLSSKGKKKVNERLNSIFSLCSFYGK